MIALKDFNTRLSSSLLPITYSNGSNSSVLTSRAVSTFSCSSIRIVALKLKSTKQYSSSARCRARRRALIRYNDEDEDEDEEYGHNEEIAMLELYSQSARDEALLVRASVDEQEAQVLIFKGFSSCLSDRTCPDPSRSVLPARAVIKSIDRIKSPFDPTNIQYIEKGLTWQNFKTRLQPT